MQESIAELVARKRAGGVFSAEEIEEMVAGVTDESLSDAEVTEWLRAVFDCGMDDVETTALTHAMLHSGAVLEWPDEWAHLVVDKHSTGGVGDKISLPLAAALAACGLKVPMISGRGLGHTGGTLDKLESLPDYRVTLSMAEIHDILENVGCLIAGQTDEIAPADRRMYAIRDVTGTVASIPLITGSIVCKKAAESPKALVLDVKVGDAAFMQTEDEARELAASMVTAGNGLGIATSAILSEMDAPIGYAIGNSLEVLESVETMRGVGPGDLEELVCVLGGILLAASGMAGDAEEGALRIFDTLHDGSALDRFQQMCIAQGTDSTLFESEHALLTGLGLLDASLNSTEVCVSEPGHVSAIDAMELALVALELGAGRKQLGDVIDHGVGIVLEAHIGSELLTGETWATIFHRGSLDQSLKQRMESAVTLSAELVEPTSRIIDVLD